MRRLSFYLFLIFVFTVPWQNAIAIGGSKTLSSFIGIAALLAAIVTLLLEGRVAKPPAFILAFGALVFWQMTTYFWSLEPELTLARAITMVQLLAMVWLATELCASERERLQLIEAFVLGCVVVCLVLVQAYFSGQPMAGYRYAPAGFNPNESADIIAAAIPLALLVVISHKRGVLRWINIAYVPLGVFAVILTASRSGFLATCLALTSVFFALRHARPLYRLVWSAVILGVFAALFFGLPVNDRLETNLQRVTLSTDTESLGTFTGRTIIWSAGLEMFTEHPVAGMGFNTFTTAVETQLGSEHAAHNIWIQTAAETGIIGLVLLTIVLATAAVPGLMWRDFRRGFHLVLFLVLMTTSLAANLVTSKALWIGLAILSATAAIPVSRPVSNARHEELDAGISIAERS